MKRGISLLIASAVCLVAVVAEPAVIRVDKIGLGTVTNDRIAQEIDRVLLERYNLKVEYVSIGWDEGTTKPGLQLLSGDAPDVIWTDQPNASYLKWVKANLLMPWSEEMLNAAPTAAAIMKDPDFANFKIKNKFYMLPQLGDPFNYKPQRSLYIRTDWLKNLGLKMPATLDDLLVVAKAFTERDPDGNGKKDTFGIGAFGKDSWAAGFGHISGYLAPAFGVLGPAEFVLKGGAPVMSGIQPEFKQYLAYMKKLYGAGVLDPEALNSASSNDMQARFSAGKVGMIFDNGGWLDKIGTNLLVVNPKATIGEIVTLTGPAGNKTRLDDTPWGAVLISAKTKVPVAVAKYLDFTLSEEYWLLNNLGIKGVHYSVDPSAPDEWVVKPFMAQRIADKLATQQKAIQTYELGWGIGNWGPPPAKFRDKVYLAGAGNAEFFKAERALYQQFGLDKPSNILSNPTVGTVSESWGVFQKKYAEILARNVPGMLRGTSDFDKGWTAMLKDFESAGGPAAVNQFLSDWRETQ